MNFGFWGFMWDLDLARREVRLLEVPPEDARKYFGGSGLGAKILLEMLDGGLGPLEPDSPLIIAGGLLTGTKVPTACRTVICGRSPLTGIWGESTAGGFFGAALKSTGVDGLLIRGKAENPVYLLITDGRVEIRDASHLWGLDTFETDEALKRETDRRAFVCAIGPCGERLIPMASVIFEGHHARAAGRCGFGASMGSKNLKAIVVRGRKRIPIRHPEALIASVKGSIPSIQKSAKSLMTFGTPGGVEAVEAHGDLPIANWTGGSWPEGAKAISGRTNLPKYFSGHYACFACPIRCGKSIRIEGGPFGDVLSHQPEYETIAGFGANLLNANYELIAVANERCNRYGIDTISASSAIAFAMECCQRGVLRPEDLGGVEPRFGDPKAILTLLDKIANGEGIGEILGRGTREAARILGPLAHEFRTDVKGLEMAYHDPRAFTCMAVNYATANRGACHLESLSYFLGRGIPLPDMGYYEPPDPHADEGKAKIAFDLQNFMAVFNPLGLCKFLMIGRVGPSQIAKWLELATGWEVDQGELLQVGERLFNLKRMYNCRLGVSRKDDSLPPRFLTHPRPDGRAKGVLPHLGKMLSQYYELRGWDREGIPTKERLVELGLSWGLEP